MTSAPQWATRGVVSLAALRLGLGVAALAFPEPAGRAWIGEGASGRDRAVILRALGGRDIALGVGALLSARRGGDLKRWAVMGGLSDLVDTAATAAAFSALPKRTRWLALLASAGAVATAAATVPLLGAVD